MKLFEIAGPDYGDSDIMFRAIVGLLKKGEALRANYVMEMHDGDGIFTARKKHDFRIFNIAQHHDEKGSWPNLPYPTNSRKVALLFKDNVGDKKVWLPYEELGNLELIHKQTHWELTGSILDGNQPGDDGPEDDWDEEDEDEDH